MGLRARFGLRDDGSPQCRIVAPGADIDAADLTQVVFDADYAAVRIAYQGQLSYSASVSQQVQSFIATWPDMGYIPYTLIGVFDPSNQFKFYQLVSGSGGISGAYLADWQGRAMMPCSYTPASGGWVNSVQGIVSSTGLTFASTFLFDGIVSYVVFDTPTG